jgi:DNA-binding transcriptional LysR family regulator
MSITKSTAVDQITVTENGIVLYREATRIMEDGKQLSETYHRSSLTPAQDLTGVPASVIAICNVAWTTEIIAAYQAQVAAQAAEVAAQAAQAEANRLTVGTE